MNQGARIVLRRYRVLDLVLHVHLAADALDGDLRLDACDATAHEELRVDALAVQVNDLREQHAADPLTAVRHGEAAAVVLAVLGRGPVGAVQEDLAATWALVDVLFLREVLLGVLIQALEGRASVGVHAGKKLVLLVGDRVLDGDPQAALSGLDNGGPEVPLKARKDLVLTCGNLLERHDRDDRLWLDGRQRGRHELVHRGDLAHGLEDAKGCCLFRQCRLEVGLVLGA